MHGSTIERILRISLSFSFLYPAISAWFNPFAWIGYFPPFLLNLAQGHDMLLLHVFGVTEIIIGLGLFFGRRVFWPASIAALYLFGIIVFNLNQMDVIFRDISILGIALVLVLGERGAQEEEEVAP